MSDRPLLFDEDNPEWTDADFAAARPAGDLPPHILAAFPRTGAARGRPAGSAKERITIRIDKDILERFRATGPGWQTRLNEALRKSG